MFGHRLTACMTLTGRAKKACAPNKWRGQTGIVVGQLQKFSGRFAPEIFLPSHIFIACSTPDRGHLEPDLVEECSVESLSERIA